MVGILAKLVQPEAGDLIEVAPHLGAQLCQQAGVAGLVLACHGDDVADQQLIGWRNRAIA